jgi:hypothetical protein
MGTPVQFARPSNIHLLRPPPRDLCTSAKLNLAPRTKTPTLEFVEPVRSHYKPREANQEHTIRCPMNPDQKGATFSGRSAKIAQPNLCAQAEGTPEETVLHVFAHCRHLAFERFCVLGKVTKNSLCKRIAENDPALLRFVDHAKMKLLSMNQSHTDRSQSET